MADLRWWPNWYVSRLHRVRGVGALGTGYAVCGTTGLRNPDDDLADWQQKRLKAGVRKCKLCLRRISPTEEESRGSINPPPC